MKVIYKYTFQKKTYKQKIDLRKNIEKKKQNHDNHEMISKIKHIDISMMKNLSEC